MFQNRAFEAWQARFIIYPMPYQPSCLEASLTEFRRYKSLAEAAISQVTDGQLKQALDVESNSIAILVKHLAGNMRSRWTDFLTNDGEKPNRNRDTEFESAPATRDELMQLWESGWNCVFAALDPLKDADLSRTVYIRGQAHSVAQAIMRQVAHYSYHVGQIVFLAKHLQSSNWKPLSISRGKSAEFNLKAFGAQTSKP